MSEIDSTETAVQESINLSGIGYLIVGTDLWREEAGWTLKSDKQYK